MVGDTERVKPENVEISRGTRFEIQEAESLDRAWDRAQRRVLARVEGYPENYLDCQELLRDFFARRWDLHTTGNVEQWAITRRSFASDADPILFDKAIPLLPVISRMFTPLDKVA